MKVKLRLLAPSAEIAEASGLEPTLPDCSGCKAAKSADYTTPLQHLQSLSLCSFRVPLKNNDFHMVWELDGKE